MHKSNNIASFMLRFTQELWQDAAEEAHIRWRGHIQHVQGHDEDRFTDFAEAIAFMQRHLTRLTTDSLGGDENVSQEKIFKESFKLWEQFASSYTNTMFQAMEQGMKQSETVKKQMEEVQENTLKAWQLPFQGTDQGPLLQTLSELQAQVESLSKKVEDLEKKLKDKE